MRFTLLSSLPWLGMPERSPLCIVPEGVDQSAGGGASGGAALAPQSTPPQVPTTPDPASLQVITRTGGTSPPKPAPQHQAPATQAASPSAVPQSAGSVPYVTKDELAAMLEEKLRPLLGQGGQAPAPQAPTPQAQSPSAPAPQAAPTAITATIVPQTQNPEFLALQTKVREQEAALSEIQKAKAQAEEKADIASATTAAQRALTDHPTYRMQSAAASQAVEVMLLKGRIAMHPQDDGTKQPYVMIPNEQTGKTDVFRLQEGVVKWLESSEGAFYRPKVPNGMGAMASSPGHAPVSVTAQTQMPQGNRTPTSLQEAFEKQQQLQGGTSQYGR